ncbi:MAG: family 20 glycosylhydrolase, partial [Flavisolibacter sp.]
MKKFFFLIILISNNVFAQQHPALIPLPQKLEWGSEFFLLKNCEAIVVKEEALQTAAKRLQESLKQKGHVVKLSNAISAKEKCIELTLAKVDVPQLPEEAYRIVITPSKVLVTANTPHGIFNAIQTLLQLIDKNKNIPSCEVVDWPAFAWRGYMIDVGRNYQSMDLLKQQIDVMSRYKFNVFHFHFTEDIAWRLAIKQYPQLTAAENMLRNKGQFYSEKDLKELIAYCKERYITLVPE